MNAHTILVVDDEAAIRKILNVGLKSFGYEVVAAANSTEALAITCEQKTDLVVLDINLETYPDGVEVCYQIRRFSSVPILILSVEQDKETKIAALNAGADDYVNKPFFMGELEARIRAILRRSAMITADNKEGHLHIKDLTIDLLNRCVFLKNEEIHLTKTEYRLLHLLATHPGKVLTHPAIMQAIWGKERPEHFVRVCTNTLRKKIGEGYIVTVPGVGYRFIDMPAAD